MQNILYLIHRMPYPPDKGDRIRNYHLLKHLSERAAVHVACLADEPVPPEHLAAIRPLCTRLTVVPNTSQRRWLRAGTSLALGHSATEGAFLAPALRALLHRWTADTAFDYCLASSSSMTPYLRLHELRTVPAVIDLVDVDSQKWFDYAAASHGPRRWAYRLEGRRLRQLERGLPTWARAVTLVSEPEAKLYQSFCRPGTVRAILNGVDLDYFRPLPLPAEPACVFVGALDYRPNVDAACWFAENVWPTIRRRRPDVALWLVGRRPSPAVCRLAKLPGVQVVGQVPDVRPYLARAALAVVPLRIARGVQNKVLEALAMSKAVIASPQALAALKVRSGTHLCSASTASQWVETVLHLLDDATMRARLGAAGRAYVAEHHDWEHCLEPFDSLLELTPQSARGDSETSWHATREPVGATHA